jgi:hypothetical protein
MRYGEKDVEMKKAIKTAILSAAMFFAPVQCEAAEGGEVLWWLIDVGYEKSIKVETPQGTVSAGDLGVNGARIRYESDSGNGYLPMFGLDENDRFVRYEGIGGVLLPAEYFGSLDGLSAESCTFVLELGNYQSGKWIGTSLESEAVSYRALVENNHITQWHETAPSYGTPWTPDGYTVVPEPNSAVMLLLGVSILALRRRRI